MFAKIFPSWSKRRLFLGAAGVILLLGLVDLWTGPALTLSVFYFAPVSFVTWRVGRLPGVGAAALSVSLWMAADTFGGVGGAFVVAWNSGVRFAFFVVTVWLVAELHTKLRDTEALALTDALTGVANNHHFVLRAQQALAFAQRQGTPLTVVYVDVDDFKQINDRRGHREGDRALRLTAQALRRQIRETDTVARLGGDEFALLLPATDGKAAAVLLERLRRTLRTEMKGHGYPVTYSIGACTFLNIPSSVESMIHVADELMYSVKHSGKDNLRHEVVVD